MKNNIYNTSAKSTALINNLLKSLILKKFILYFLFSSFMFVNAYAQEIKIVKSGPSVANPGESITYIIALRSDGLALSDLVVTDYLPSVNSSTYLSSIPSGNYNKETNTLSWDKNNNPNLVSLGKDEIYISVTVKVGTLKMGSYIVPDAVTKLSSYTAVNANKENKIQKSNIVRTDVPKTGGAKLPVE